MILLQGTVASVAASICTVIKYNLAHGAEQDTLTRIDFIHEAKRVLTTT